MFVKAKVRYCIHFSGSFDLKNKQKKMTLFMITNLRRFKGGWHRCLWIPNLTALGDVKFFVLIWLCWSWSCPVKIFRGKSHNITDRNARLLCVFRAFFSWSWHEGCQRGQGCKPFCLYQVTAPVWSLPLGQGAAHVSSNWLEVRMRLPWNMSSF